VLRVVDLTVTIGGQSVVEGVSLSLGKREILAVVGESGCGKSITALSILGLQPNAARIANGRIEFDGEDLVAMGESRLRVVRGDRISMIFQEPVISLNPLMPVGVQVAEVLRVHRDVSSREAAREAVEMLRLVGIADPERRAGQFPFELSGGMCQRIMIAAALIARPAVLIADEPTTALDVTIQAQILHLLQRLRDQAGTTILLITHDMGVVAEMADRVAVMYGGRIVETASVDAIFAAPAHPYTRLLLATLPGVTTIRRAPLRTIAGNVPGSGEWPDGCRFRTRCPLADGLCRETPLLTPVSAAHRAACWHTDRAAALA
jgi:peptide/nickel transport system ATP-binding protein